MRQQPLTISVVTPSFNQARYLEACLESVHGQGYGALEHVVIDGGSTDGCVDILKRYEDRLGYWVSEPDGGQYEAINKGFAKTQGEIMCWLNSDDLYLPWTLATVGEIFRAMPEVEWITSLYPMKWDTEGRAVQCNHREGYSRKGFMRGDYLDLPGRCSRGWLQQESTFWRRSLWKRCGGEVRADMRLAADFDLWLRFAKETELYGVMVPLGGYRVHQEQKTASGRREYEQEAVEALRARGGRQAGPLESWWRCRVLPRLPFRSRLARWNLTEEYPVIEYSLQEQAWKIKRR